MPREHLTPEEFVGQIQYAYPALNLVEFERLTNYARAYSVVTCAGYIPDELEAQLQELESRK